MEYMVLQIYGSNDKLLYPNMQGFIFFMEADIPSLDSLSSLLFIPPMQHYFLATTIYKAQTFANKRLFSSMQASLFTTATGFP